MASGGVDTLEGRVLTTGMHIEVQQIVEESSTERVAWMAGELLAAESRALASRLLEDLEPEVEEFL